MRLHVILRYVSLVLLLNAVFLFLSAGVSLIHSDTAFLSLLYSAILSLLFGVFPAIFVPSFEDITNREGFIIVVLGWLVSCLAGVLPYLLWGGVFSFTNAWFESVSGFTTTGSSILADIESIPAGLLFWRSSTHWIGGIGIIVFALSVLPAMGRVRMILYLKEMSPIALKNFRYRTKEALRVLLAVYVGLTLFETFALIACGMNPCYGDLDPYWMAASAIDEALRNCVAVGADPRRIAILDNFCWGNTDRPETLGSLVRAALACHDLALALGTPFISGKDSLNNEFRPHGADQPISIPPSLLISAMGQMDDVSRAVTMDLKQAGNHLYLVGTTRNELGGSHLALVHGQSGGEVPRVDAPLAKRTFAALHAAIHAGLLRACHDLSEGGLAVAAAEMAFAGELGAEIDLQRAPRDLPADLPDADTVLLFSESNTRFLCEVTPQQAAAFEAALAGVPQARVGQVTATGRLRIQSGDKGLVDADWAALKAAWQRPLHW